MPTSYKHQLDTLLTRFNFYFTKNQISQVIATTSRSKGGFKDDVLAVIDGNNDLKDKVNELGLLALQLDTRQVEVYSITNANDLAALGSLFTTVKMTTEAVITDAFPFPIEGKNDLSKLSTSVVYPILADTVNLGTDVYDRLVVTTIVDKEVEEPVPANHLSQTGQTLQDANTTFTMRKKVRTQLFHVVYWCSALSKLILSVDRNVLSHNVSLDQLFLLRQFLMLRKIDCGLATNVFGAIEKLYSAANGHVTKLGHVTTDGNPVRIPLKGKQKCLKQDNYHQAGEGGGHVHAKFAVSKKWEFTVAGTKRSVDIEVGLMGHPKMLDTAQPLTDFSVNKSKRLEDFNFAINEVLFHA